MDEDPEGETAVETKSEELAALTASLERQRGGVDAMDHDHNENPFEGGLFEASPAAHPDEDDDCALLSTEMNQIALGEYGRPGGVLGGGVGGSAPLGRGEGMYGLDHLPELLDLSSEHFHGNLEIDVEARMYRRYTVARGGSVNTQRTYTPPSAWREGENPTANAEGYETP